MDGIISVQFTDKINDNNKFYACVVYLPPENSTRAVNIYEFLDTLMTQVYTIPDGKMFYLCENCNSRCGDLSNFVEGVDNLPECSIVDFKFDRYGSMLCDF